MSMGTVVSVTELVVDVSFSEDIPSINEVLIVQNVSQAKLLVDHIMPVGIARCLNIDSDKNIERNMPVERTGESISIPVGDNAIGRVFNAFGKTIDDMPPLDIKNMQRKNILDMPPEP